MIKVQDFAAQKGVTDKAIYKHLNKNKEALAGHFEKRGKNGTWLDDFACNFISDLMIKAPIVLSDGQDRDEIERLRKKIEELQDELAGSNKKGRELAEKMLEMKDEMTNLQLENRSLQLKIEYHEKEQQKKKGFFSWFKKAD